MNLSFRSKQIILVHRHFDRVFRDFERTANSYWWRWPVSSFRRTLPEPSETKLSSGERVYRIEVDLQNFKPEDVKVSIKKGQVFISAKSELSEGAVKKNEEFTYEYTLPEEANAEKVRSVLKADGRLVIEAPLPEIEAKQKGDREIPITKE